MDHLTDLRASMRNALDREAKLQGRSLTEFDRKVAESVFMAGELALEDRKTARARYRVVSAPTGAGKSSSARALIRGLLDVDPDSSVVFLCETIDQCDSTYRDLSQLLSDYPGGTVGIWTKAHDESTSRERALRDYGIDPAHQQTKGELAEQRVIVVTHALYKGVGGACSRLYQGGPRTLTILDEKPTEVDIYDVSTGTVKEARDILAEQVGADDEAVRHLDWLHCYLEGRWRDGEGRTAFEPLCGIAMVFSSPDDEHGIRTCSPEWFTSGAASEAVAGAGDGPVRAAVGFGRALSRGCAFLCRYDRCGGPGGRFLGYEMNMPVHPGTVMLDATADIDGITPILDSRVLVDTPQVDYRNLTISHVEPCSTVMRKGERISEIVKSAARADPYARWIEEAIIAHTTPGEWILAVVHKALLDHRYLSDTAKRWATAAELPEDRKVCFINWGMGIGANHWREATTVFLFGEFHVPKRATIGTVLGVRQEQANSGYLDKVQSPRAKEPLFESVSLGHLARWEKQLALRGNARNIDADGVCGRQKLVMTGEFGRLASNKRRLFPGATFTQTAESKEATRQGGETALISLFADSSHSNLTARDIREKTGIDMRKKRKWYLDRPGVQRVMDDYGWRYVQGKSRTNPSRFVRGEAGSGVEVGV